MAFQGDLRNIGLATVFQNLQQNLQTGTLKLRRERMERYVYVRSGMISMASAGPGAETPVGDYLRRAGKIGAEELEAARKRRRKGSRLGAALEKCDGLCEDDVRQSVREYVEEEIYGLFTWPEGSFEFTEGEPADEIFDAEVRNARLSLDPNGLILEAARRVDEWERINRVVGSLDDIYVPREECSDELGASTDPHLGRILGLLDGTHDVAAVIRDSALGRYAVFQTLSKLITGRKVRPISTEEMRGLAERAEAAFDDEQAKTLLRKILEFERNDVAVRRRLAALLERSGEKEDAASEHKLLANSLLDSGRTAEAADALRRAIALMPTDVGTRERLFRIISESGAMTVALETGQGLAETYAMLGLNEKARDAIQRVLALNPKDRLPLENRLIEINLGLGDVPAAVEVLRRAAQRYLKAREYDEAGDFYERLLKLDPSDDEARKRMTEIHAGVIERRIERGRRIRRWLIASAFALPFVLFLAREMAAKPAESRARLAAMESAIGAARMRGEGESVLSSGLSQAAAEVFDVAAGRFEEAALDVEAFRREWRWTLSSSYAAELEAELRKQAALARLLQADAYRRQGLFRDEYEVLRRVSRSTHAGDQGKMAEERLRMLKGLIEKVSEEPR